MQCGGHERWRKRLVGIGTDEVGELKRPPAETLRPRAVSGMGPASHITRDQVRIVSKPFLAPPRTPSGASTEADAGGAVHPKIGLPPPKPPVIGMRVAHSANGPCAAPLNAGPAKAWATGPSDHRRRAAPTQRVVRQSHAWRLDPAAGGLKGPK